MPFTAWSENVKILAKHSAACHVKPTAASALQSSGFCLVRMVQCARQGGAVGFDVRADVGGSRQTCGRCRDWCRRRIR